MYAEEQGEAKKEERQWGKQKADAIELRVHEGAVFVCDRGASCRSVATLGSVTEAASERLANLPVESTAGKNRNTWVRHCSMTALLDTLVEHSSLTLL